MTGWNKTNFVGDPVQFPTPFTWNSQSSTEFQASLSPLPRHWSILSCNEKSGCLWVAQWLQSAVRRSLLSCHVKVYMSRLSPNEFATCYKNIFTNMSHSSHLHPWFIISGILKTLRKKNHWVENGHFRLLSFFTGNKLTCKIFSIKV